MDSRSSSSPTPHRPRDARWRAAAGWLLGALLAASALAGCGRHAVKPAEKTLLTDRIMRFDDDPRGSAARSRVDTCREGSAGQPQGGAGGCR